MKFELEDGTFAHLTNIVQTTSYRRGYATQPQDPEEEIKNIARKYLAAGCWKDAPLLLIGVESTNLTEQMRSQKLPLVMCIGEFVSYRARNAAYKKAVFVDAIWLQDQFSPHLSDHNMSHFRHISWDNY